MIMIMIMTLADTYPSPTLPRSSTSTDGMATAVREVDMGIPQSIYITSCSIASMVDDHGCNIDM